MYPFAPFIAVIPAIIIRTDRGIIRDLRAAGATTPERAIVLGGRPIRRMRTSRLTGAGALRAVGGDRHYLVEDGWDAYQRSRRRGVLIAATVSLLMIAIGYMMLNADR